MKRVFIVIILMYMNVHSFLYIFYLFFQTVLNNIYLIKECIFNKGKKINKVSKIFLLFLMSIINSQDVAISKKLHLALII